MQAVCDIDNPDKVCEGCPHHWILTMYGSAEKAFAEGGRDDIEAICAEHGASYDGGGMWIGPLPGTERV